MPEPLACSQRSGTSWTPGATASQWSWSDAGLASLVAAGAAHVPLLAAGLFACVALELLGSGSRAARSDAVAEPLGVHESPVSRAA